MSTVESEAPTQSSFSKETPGEAGFSDDIIYSSVSKSAIASVFLGLLAALSMFAPPLLLFAVLALTFGLYGWRTISKYPDEFQGLPFALAGVALGGIFLVVAPIYHTTIYLTEVPEGYERLSFRTLMTGKKERDYPPAEAFEFDGQKIFIAGYIHPTSMEHAKSRKFVLVPDMGTCCFGKQPPLTHMIEVRLKGKQYAHRTVRRQRLAGTLHVSPQLKSVSGLEGVYYELEADILK